MLNKYAVARSRLPLVILTISSVWAGAASAGGISTLVATGAEGLSLEARVRQLEDEATIRRQLEDYMGLLRSRDWDNYIKMFAKAAPELHMAEGTVVGRDAIRTRMDNASKRMAAAAAAANRPQLQRADVLSDVESKSRATRPPRARASRFSASSPTARRVHRLRDLHRHVGARRRRVANQEPNRRLGPASGARRPA